MAGRHRSKEKSCLGLVSSLISVADMALVDYLFLAQLAFATMVGTLEGTRTCSALASRFLLDDLHPLRMRYLVQHI